MRSTQPDGKLATSKGVVVALDGVESSPGVVRSRAEAQLNAPETVVANRSVLDQTVGSSLAHQLSQLPSQIAKRQDVAVSQLPHPIAVTPLSEGGSPSAVVVPNIATAVVSRGDSLWRISRLTYGEGMRYEFVYKANRNQIRNPNRIYPGQIFVLPMKSALKRRGNSSVCTRDGCARLLLALDHAPHAIATRRRRWPSDVEHSGKQVLLSRSHLALALGAALPMP